MPIVTNPVRQGLAVPTAQNQAPGTIQYQATPVANTAQFKAADADSTAKVRESLLGTVAQVGAQFKQGANQQIATVAMRDAVRQDPNQYVAEDKLLKGLYDQSYNQTAANQEVADFQSTIQSAYQEGLAQGLRPDEVQKQLYQKATEMDDRLSKLTGLTPEFVEGLRKQTQASFTSINKIGKELQAAQSVANAQSGLDTLVGSSVDGIGMALSAGDTGGAQAQAQAAITNIDQAQWLNAEQKRGAKQQMYLAVAASATDPATVQWAQAQAEQADPANVLLRPKFKDLQSQAGAQVRADAIDAETAFNTSPSLETASTYKAALDRAASAGALTAEQVAQQQQQFAKGLKLVQQQATFSSALQSGVSVRTAANQSGLDPDKALKLVTDKITTVAAGAGALRTAALNKDPDLYAASAKATAKLISPVLSVLNSFKGNEDITPEIEQALQQVQSLPVDVRNSVVAELPTETQAVLAYMQERGGISTQSFKAGIQDMQASKKLASLPGTSKEKREAMQDSVSNLNNRLWTKSALARDAGNDARIMQVLRQESDGMTTEQWELSGFKAAEVKAQQRILTVGMQEPGLSLNRAVAVTTSKGSTVQSVAQTLGVGAYMQEFTAQQLQELRAAYPGKEFGNIEYQPDGSLSVQIRDEEGLNSQTFQIPAGDMQDRVQKFQLDTKKQDEAFYYHNATTKPVYAAGQQNPVLITGADVDSSGIKVPAATVTNVASAIMMNEGYSATPYKDGATASTEGFGVSTAGGHEVGTGRTAQEHAENTVSLVEKQYMPKALSALSSAGIKTPDEKAVMLLTDLAYQGFGGADKVAKALAAGDKPGALAALKATPAYKQAGADRNKKRVAWIEESINNMNGAAQAQTAINAASRAAKY